MTTDDQEKIESAAEFEKAKADEEHRLRTKTHHNYDDIDRYSFQRGADFGVAFRDKNPSPKVVRLIKDLITQCDFASEILTLTHKELGDVEMNTLTTRQYMLWSRSARSDAVERAREDIAQFDQTAETKE